MIVALLMRRVRRFLLLATLTWAWRNRQMLTTLVRTRDLSMARQSGKGPATATSVTPVP